MSDDDRTDHETKLREAANELDEAAEHADLGLPVGPDVPHSGFQRIVARIAGRLTTRQAAFNHAMLDAVQTQQLALEEVHHEVSGLTAAIDALRAELQRAHADRRQELARWRSDDAMVQMVLREVRDGRSARAAVDAVVDRADGADRFYADFENMFRGSEEAIRQRLAAYVPDLAAVASLGRVVDLGTGRGEFLDLVAEAGIDAYGVDTNTVTIAQCRERGREVVESDAIAHLRAVPDSSLAAVVAFHLVEHLPFPLLLDLADQAIRVLKPGGLLVLETPNPSNLVVGAVNFYLDPTHLRPIPPPLLHAVLWSRGFDPIEIRYLNPAHERFDLPEDLGDVRAALQPVLERLNEMFFGPSDYAVIGRRVGADAVADGPRQ